MQPTGAFPAQLVELRAAPDLVRLRLLTAEGVAVDIIPVPEAAGHALRHVGQ